MPELEGPDHIMGMKSCAWIPAAERENRKSATAPDGLPRSQDSAHPRHRRCRAARRATAVNWRVGVYGVARLAVTSAFYVQSIALRRELPGPRARQRLQHDVDRDRAKPLRGSRLVYDSHELWPDRNGRPEWRPWLVACEALFVRVADATITTSPGYAAAMASRYRVAPPIVVRNVPALTGGARRRVPPDDRDSAVAVYVGGLMPGRGLEQAIDALAQAPGVRLRLIGPGRESYRDALRQRIDAAGMSDRVDVRTAVAPSTVLDAIADADMGLMLIQPICRSYELTLPNKLFEYAAAGLPILASDLPVIGPLVRDEGLGEVVAAADLEQIALAMRRLAEPGTTGGCATGFAPTASG